MIAITGAGGFIGSVLLGYINSLGVSNIRIFDDLPHGDQFKNLAGKQYVRLHAADKIVEDITCVIHIGANANTLEKDWQQLYRSNILSTRHWHDFARSKSIPFIFTSSAAIYGIGQGPTNHYAFSKLENERDISHGVILRLFNVYGPNEYHKGRMASTVMHWYNQLTTSSELKIFENSDEYFRDFIYVEDVVKTIWHFAQNYQPGVYDLGTGWATSFKTVADVLTSHIIGKKTYIAMPQDLKSQYQTHTQANTTDLINAGVNVSKFKSIHAGVAEYLDFLKVNRYY